MVLFEALIKPMIACASGLVQLILQRPRVKLFCGWSYEVNADECGTYLALSIKIANPGSKAVYFERLEARTKTKQSYFPSFSGLISGTEIKPGAGVVGHIPVGHIDGHGVVELRMYDSVERVFKLRGRTFQKTLKALAEEKVRLESLGFSVHPSSSVRSAANAA